MPEKDAMDYLCNQIPLPDNRQIRHEIDYFFHYYKMLLPKVFISYDREAFYGKEDHDFRITFDDNILWHDYDLSLTKGAYGNPILQEGYSLMEIKTAYAMPLWITRILSKNHIYKTSFSKYGTAYKYIKNAAES